MIPGASISETLKEVENKTVIRTIPRENYRRIQTPQVFRYDLLKQIYSQKYSHEMTDEAMMVESLKIAVHVVEGEPQNIKITTPFDYQVACAICDGYL